MLAPRASALALASPLHAARPSSDTFSPVLWDPILHEVHNAQPIGLLDGILGAWPTIRTTRAHGRLGQSRSVGNMSDIPSNMVTRLNVM